MFRRVSHGSVRRPMRRCENVSMRAVLCPFPGWWVHHASNGLETCWAPSASPPRGRRVGDG
eukprot:6878277-Pyramimonas_sp.AAC.1